MICVTDEGTHAGSTMAILTTREEFNTICDNHLQMTNRAVISSIGAMPMPQNSIALAVLALAPLVAIHASDTPATTDEKPNIVLIFADDLGYGDPGCYGGKLAPTPAIDSLARDGVRCTDGYATAPVCAPSRCGIMTGAYNQRFGMEWNDDRTKYHIGSHKLLPQALKAAGYVTAHIGKWNVGADITGCFDETYDVIDWEADYFPNPAGHYRGVDSATEHDSGKVHGIWGPERPDDEYLTDRMGRHAVEFIEKHQENKQPFFLYLAFNAVHSPWQAKAADRARFAHLEPQPLQYYAAMLASLDENIGRVLAKLKDAGLADNTIVAFASDNGPAIIKAGFKGRPADWPQELLFGSAGPLRSHKAQFFEGGIRVPFIVRWPARLKAGGEYRQVVSTMDFYPTFCAAAGAPVPDETKLDGVNLLPFLNGEQTGAPHATLFWKNGDEGAVRQGDWKLVINRWAPKLQLYNLADDIGEKNDLAESKPDLVKPLHQAWLDWKAPFPPRNNRQPAKPGPNKTGPNKPAPDRAALFGMKDGNHDGKLSMEEFLANQADPEAAKKRLAQWDTDEDGFLTRGEFVTMGKNR